jgi:DNA modification methylase
VKREDVIRVQERIDLLPTAELVPYARNSRTHSPEQVRQIAASIREFGFTNPVLIDGADGIIAGHGRVMAAKELGLAEVPCIRLSHLSEQQKRAYVIADNKLAENAGWDREVLSGEMELLRLGDYDLALLGFDADDLDEMFPPVPPADGPDPDACPVEEAAAVSVAGDVWHLGAHRVICGDSTAIKTWDALMAGELADVVWTDPPYNVAYESKKTGRIANDDMKDAEFLLFLGGVCRCLFSVTRPGASIYVAHADTEGLNFRRAFREAGFKLSGCLIWKKNQLVLGRSDYQWIHEPILYGWKPGHRHRWFGGRRQTTVQDMGGGSPFTLQADGSWAVRIGDETLVVSGETKLMSQETNSVVNVEKPARSELHPTMKPVALIERMLCNSARAGDLVVDAFGGSGSTLIAAERLGMSARLVELEARFVDVIVRRWQDYTGDVARHAVTGQTFDETARRAAT